MDHETPFEVLSTEIGIGRGDVDFTQVLALDTPQNGVKAATRERFLIEIRSNSYEFQCHCRIKRWSGKRWEFLAGRHYSTMRTPASLDSHKAFRTTDPGYPGRQMDREAYFEADVFHLMERALEVIG